MKNLTDNSEFKDNDLEEDSQTDMCDLCDFFTKTIPRKQNAAEEKCNRSAKVHISDKKRLKRLRLKSQMNQMCIKR